MIGVGGANVIDLCSSSHQSERIQRTNPAQALFPYRAARRWPIVRPITLSERDLAVINRHRRAENRLGFALQLCYLRYPGRKWGPQEAVPPHILTYVAQQLGVEPAVVRVYAQDRPATRLRHLEEIQAEFGFQPFSPDIAQEMSEWLLPQALRADQGLALSSLGTAG